MFCASPRGAAGLTSGVLAYPTVDRLANVDCVAHGTLLAWDEGLHVTPVRPHVKSSVNK